MNKADSLEIYDLARVMKHLPGIDDHPIEVLFTGGEPMLNPSRLVDYLAIISDHADVSSLALCSNGTIPFTDFMSRVSSSVGCRTAILTIDTWGSSSQRRKGKAAVVGSEAMALVPAHRDFQVGIVTPLHPSLDFDSYRAIVEHALEKGIAYFEINLIKGLHYRDELAVAQFLSSALDLFLPMPSIRLCGDWLSVFESGRVLCKRNEGSEVRYVVFPNGRTATCELDCSAESPADTQDDGCRYANPQAVSICSLVKKLRRGLA